MLSLESFTSPRRNLDNFRKKIITPESNPRANSTLGHNPQNPPPEKEKILARALFEQVSSRRHWRPPPVAPTRTLKGCLATVGFQAKPLEVRV